MSARILGFTPTTLAPGPDLMLARDPDGKTTAQRTFTCLKQYLHTPAIQGKLKKGTPITTLCSDIPSDFQHLEIDSHASRDAPGGFTAIDITFTGYTESGDFGFDREINYSLRGSTFRRPITEHPTFIADMAAAASPKIGQGLVAVLNGSALGSGTNPANYKIVQISPLEEIIGSGGWIDSDDNNAWWDIIVKKGLRDYDAASFEWTRSTANAGGLSNADIAKFGQASTPPGSPPEPEEEGWWQLADLSDDRSSNASSNSLTWRWNFGTPDPKLYGDG